MKKLYSTTSYKEWNTKQAKRSWKRNLATKEQRKAIRRGTEGIKKKVLRERREEEKFAKIKAPGNFSFVENTEEILHFLNELRDLFRKKKNTFVDLRRVTNLNNDAIVLFISLIQNPKIVNGVRVWGSYPLNEKLRKIFIESGAFGTVTNEDTGYKNYILTRRNKKAEGGIAADVIRRATKVVFKKEGRCPGVYRALMESMANTCYHAKPTRIGEETWFLTVYHDRDKGHVSFAFIDLGVGIFKSAKMNDFKMKAVEFFGWNDNKQILKEIISGNKQSSTKIPYRGKGLPTIYMGLERNYYSNLHIISNDVKANLTSGEYTDLKSEFNGTFIYFELNNTNRWIQ